MSDTLKVVTLLGSLRKGSFNGMVARTCGIAPAGISRCRRSVISRCTMLICRRKKVSQRVQEIAQQIREADGVVIVTQNITIPCPAA
ncbi:NAD(P)H-dependent oxidoreductase [Klebsiella pneumoniae]|uniref:NAD(P)H-dependent oxidoreductase n=1 Tax=Klebsiella pneumoniae TaxID=573 RepID=UPI002265D7D3|nr:NAD(P)H-dependent oxidoreductase [Klebsiella pneumoniae]